MVQVGDDLWAIQNENHAEQVFGLLETSYATALSTFDRSTLRTYPANTDVFTGRIEGELVATTALKRADDVASLDDRLEVRVEVLRNAMVAQAIKTLGKSAVGGLHATLEALEQLVERATLDELLRHAVHGTYRVAAQDQQGQGARVHFPIGVSARAANAREHRGLNKYLRLHAIYVARLRGYKALAGLNASGTGLAKRLEEIGYSIFPVTTERAIFPGEQHVSWLPAQRFRQVLAHLSKQQRASDALSTTWDIDTRFVIDNLGGESW